MNDNAPANERKQWSQPAVESLPIQQTMAAPFSLPGQTPLAQQFQS